MNDDKRLLNNIEGLRLLKLTKLDYSKRIISLLKDNPNYLLVLIEEMQLTEEDFCDYLLVNKQVDITFYDQALSSLLLMNTRKIELKKEIVAKN